MKLIKQLLLALCLIYILQFEVLGQDWLGRITSMRTNVDEVEQMFKESPEKKIDSYFFELKEGNLIVYFSPDNCLSGAYGGWDVPKGTVTHITFYPKKKRKLSYYKVDIEKMEKGFDSGHRLFTDNEQGVMYSTQFNKVESIRYFPALKYVNLRCAKNG